MSFIANQKRIQAGELAEQVQQFQEEGCPWSYGFGFLSDKPTQAAVTHTDSSFRVSFSVQPLTAPQA